MAKKREHVQDYGTEYDPVVDEYILISELVAEQGAELSAEEPPHSLACPNAGTRSPFWRVRR